ncbi:uncharacterized protein LOC130362543 isoform X2 [Hyla sarda]|uniref:uncharacterized protein LOC130362543 isoform X2 n=1 Tax=Hyla sarda TaxID=327740 RepID=UPI0024C320E7|nr:uncharacterized protein LOC130362543 isoform X2 [Hyla sarda]XP_056423172.1 uncharacterized protein LOC130362543 isoform X2 [Hyla sarda]
MMRAPKLREKLKQREDKEMDSFSYCDISSVFITKTIHRIISPMAVQLCHLIISMQCNGNKYIVISGDLEQLAEELSKFTEHFANTSLRLKEEYDDATFAQEMEKAAKSLQVFGKNILLSIQKLCIQPTVPNHQEELVIAAQNVLMGTLKILQLEDDAGVRKIHRAADWLLECLTYLQKAESTSHLQANFWEFSEALLLLNCLTKNRVFDLKDSLHQKHLAQKLQTLHKCVPMLYTALQSSIKHPCNDQIIDSKLYIFDQTSKTIHDLKHLLTTDPDRHEVKKQGSFTQELYTLLNILSDPKPTELLNSDLDFLVGAIIFYCIYVADYSRPYIKLQLVKHCQNLLEKRKRLCDHLKELQETPCRSLFDLQAQCASMRVQLNDINENLISSIFYQILDAFTVKDPLKRLLRAALKMNKKTSLHSEHLFASKAFQPLLQAFQNHTDQLLKISSFVLAQCSQEQIINEIQSSVDCLCRVRNEVIALVLDTNKANYECKMFEKAQSIYQKWIKATESLIMSLDGILTVHQFLELSIKEIQKNKYRCEKLLRSQEPEIFQYHAADLCDLAERVAQVVTRHVDQSKSPIFRNGLRVLVRQLETLVLETRTAMIQCLEKISCFTTQNHFLEKVNLLFKSIYNVQEGITGSKHPDLLSPLRNEGGPVTHKVTTIDLNESEESHDYNEKTHREQHKTCSSYEGYLSKPVPLSNTGKMIRKSVNVESTIQVTDFHPLVSKLLSAVKKQNTKEIHECSSLLHEIYDIYLEVANDALLHGNIVEKDELKYKDTEALILTLVQFSKKENIEPALEIGTAMLLSHQIENMKTYFISLANCWYSFSYHLFCNSKNTECATINVELFNRLMQCFSRIVEAIREHLLGHYVDGLKFTDFSGIQEYVVKIQVQFSKCQATANRLLTEVLCSGMQSENSKLEYVCIFWAVSVQQLSRLLDVFIGTNNLSITGPTDWTQLNISESRSLVFLCETSLWLQEAAVILINNFIDEKEQKKVLLLKEEMGCLTESLLKLREDLNSSSPTDLSFNVDYMLLQIELMLKTKLIMIHVKKLYRGSQTLIHFDIFSCNSNNRFLAMRSLENNAKSLVDKVTLVKETLKNSPDVINNEELILLVDHLHSLTQDIAARSKLFMDIQYEWDLLMLEAMLLNWSAKAEQFISRVCTDAELDVSVVKFIKQCLTSRERTETTMTDTDVLYNDTSNVSIQSMNINVKQQRAETECEQKASTSTKQDAKNEDCSVTVYKQIAACSNKQSEINSSDKVTLESGLISKEQSAVDGTQRKKLNSRQKSSVRRLMKVVRSKRGIATNDKHNKNFTERHSKAHGVTLEKTMSTESDESHLEVNIKRDNGEDLIYQNLHVNIGVENSLVNQESPTLTLDTTVIRAEKETTDQEAKNLKTHTLFTVVKKRVSHQETKLHKTPEAMQKDTLTQQLINEKEIPENIQGISIEETKDKQTNRHSTMVQNNETNLEPKKIGTLHSDEQNKETNHKVSDQLSGNASRLGDELNVEYPAPNHSICEQQKKYQQESTNYKMLLDHKKGRTEITKKESVIAKPCMTPIDSQKEFFRGQKKTHKEQPRSETENKQLSISNRSDNSNNETQQQIKLRKEHKTCPIAQPGMNILKMDYKKKPATVFWDNLSSTTVVVEHAKVKCTSLEDMQNVHRHSQRFTKCLLAEEVETWEGETNTVVKITREMATQMSNMIQYLDRKGPIKV